MLMRAAAVLLIVVAGWAFQAIQPPRPKICGSPDGPPITSPRIQLRDGRHLAYKEVGSTKEKANYKIIVVHGLDGSKDFTLPASQVTWSKTCSLTAEVNFGLKRLGPGPRPDQFHGLWFQELVDELGIYFLSYDRAGYGESDPNPRRTVKSEAMDIQELADQLEIGPKFYLIGASMGGYAAWSCLNYIPHRLAGAALVVPIINYWWPSFPANLTRQVYKNMLVQDQRTLWIAHHIPSLLYAWMTQKWLPTSAVIERDPRIYSDQDKEILQKMAESNVFQDKARQQGVFESLHRDLIVAYSNWEFDPMTMSNPFPHDEGTVHIWQGYKDGLIPVELQRYVAQKLPWIRYHEIPEGGHLFLLIDGWSDTILKALLLG